MRYHSSHLVRLVSRTPIGMITTTRNVHKEKHLEKVLECQQDPPLALLQIPLPSGYDAKRSRAAACPTEEIEGI